MTEAKEPGHVFSLSEKAARDAHEHSRDALFEHNRNFLMRIYPFGLRVTSSNLDPSFFWRQGAQIVALNWQSIDKGTMLNQGMFAGEQGWVRKPLGYRSSDEAPLHRNVELSIEVFAAQDLPQPSEHTHVRGFHPYVVAYLHVEQPEEGSEAPRGDSSTDSKGTSQKRTVKSSSGSDPDFGSQVIHFNTVPGVIEELSFVRFVFVFIFIFSFYLLLHACCIGFSYPTSWHPASVCESNLISSASYCIQPS